MAISISADQAQRIQHDVLGRQSPARQAGTNLYLHHEVLPRGFALDNGPNKLVVERDSVFVFADDAPRLNWAHPCRYLFYSPASGQLDREVVAEFPPSISWLSPAFQIFHQPVAFPPQRRPDLTQLQRAPLKPRPIATESGGKRYALLYSGHSNNRHLNDLEFLYRTLVDLYDFDPACIYALNYDGTINYQQASAPLRWPGDNTTYRIKITGPGTPDAIDAAFDALKGRLQRNDLLVIHTNNHGGHNDSGSYLCTHDPATGGWGPGYSVSRFAGKLAALPRFSQLMVMMEQCHAGGFNEPVLSNSTADQTTIASACREDKNSDGGPEWDPFALDWIEAITEAQPDSGSLVFDPDANRNAMISASEAFQYADDGRVKDASDTPVFGDKPAGCGKTMNLGRRETRNVDAHGAPVYAACRDPNKLDVFVVGHGGGIYAAAWEQTVDAGKWRGWWSIAGGTAAPRAPVTGISRAHDKLDVFVVGTDGRIYTAAWDQAVDRFVGFWRGWWPITDGTATQGALVTPVARAADKLDVFLAGTNGGIYTAAWDQHVSDGKWRGWWRIGDAVVTPGAAVTAVARDPDKLDVFAVGKDGGVYTAAWDQHVSDGKWRGWWQIAGCHAAAGSLVSVVARDGHKLDIFFTGSDGKIYTAAWDQNVAGAKWRGPWQIAGGSAPAGSPVTAVSRDPNKLDVFVVGNNQRIYTAAWDQNVAHGEWRGWWPIVNGSADPRALVSAVSRDPNKLDVFVAGQNGTVYTAAWDQNVASGQWRGWWPIAPASP